MIQISFEAEGFAPVEAAKGACLADALDGPHSPVFFGCKTGDCGTCVVDIDPEGFAALPPASAEEQATLDCYAVGRPHARLACQIHAVAPMRLTF